MRDVLLRRRGVDWQEFCHNSGVEASVAECQNFLTAGMELRLQRGFSAATADANNLWVELGLGYRAASYGSFGIAMMTASNLAEIFEDCPQYQALTYSLIRYSFVSASDGSSCLVGEDEGIPEAFRNFTQYRDLGLLRTLLQDLVGDVSTVLDSISVAAPQPDNWDELKRYFPCRVDFNAHLTQWRFRRGATSVPIVMADKNLFAAYREECVRQIATVSGGASLVQRLETLLDRNECWFPTLGEVARSFAMSERTLHRRLKAEGRTLSEVVNEIRMRKAKRLISASCASLPDIATQLQFSDASGLSRAFKRHTGMSIRDFRQAIHAKKTEELTALASR